MTHVLTLVSIVPFNTYQEHSQQNSISHRQLEFILLYIYLFILFGGLEHPLLHKEQCDYIFCSSIHAHAHRGPVVSVFLLLLLMLNDCLCSLLAICWKCADEVIAVISPVCCDYYLSCKSSFQWRCVGGTSDRTKAIKG